MKAITRKALQAAILAGSMLGAAAFAAPPGPPPACSTAYNGDLMGVPVINCAGFVEGNLINAAASPAASALLAGMGVGSDGHAISLASVSGSTLTFSQLLTGITVIGLHVGGGSEHDGHFKESTAFYTFDAGAGTYSVDTRFDTLSNGGLYMTSPVPEPATYGMLLAGLGLLGVALRRRPS
jgi:hypothetical protein